MGTESSIHANHSTMLSVGGPCAGFNTTTHAQVALIVGKNMEARPDEEWYKYLGEFSPENRRLRADHVTIFRAVSWKTKQAWVELLLWVRSKPTESNCTDVLSQHKEERPI